MKDLIDRATAIDAVCKSECDSGFCWIPCPEVNALKCLPPAEFAKNLQPTCNQLATNDIDIQETDGVYEHCDDCIHEADSIDICILRQCKHAIAELKECYEPKQPERKRGKWIDYTDEGYVECPFCHSATNCDGNEDELHFCFSCGADMREDDHEAR